MVAKKEKKNVTLYRGELSPAKAAAAMQAARMNAIDLMETAEILFDLKRFSHSTALSILAIEEASKVTLILSIFLGFGTKDKLWRAYRTHREKSQFLNVEIQSRARAVFPDILSLQMAEELGELGPTPDEMESQKQRAVYSDCLLVARRIKVHLPRNLDWRQICWERFCEAQSLTLGLRDYSPTELKVWLKHAKSAQAQGAGFAEVLKPLHDELVARGFIKEGDWRTILSDTEQFREKA